MEIRTLLLLRAPELACRAPGRGFALRALGAAFCWRRALPLRADVAVAGLRSGRALARSCARAPPPPFCCYRVALFCSLFLALSVACLPSALPPPRPCPSCCLLLAGRSALSPSRPPACPSAGVCPGFRRPFFFSRRRGYPPVAVLLSPCPCARPSLLCFCLRLWLSSASPCVSRARPSPVSRLALAHALRPASCFFDFSFFLAPFPSKTEGRPGGTLKNFEKKRSNFLIEKSTPRIKARF